MKLQIIARTNQINFISDIITIVMTGFETQKHTYDMSISEHTVGVLQILQKLDFGILLGLR